MMRPIKFEKDNKINLNHLKLQMDRRVDLITMMIKGMRPNKPQKLCAQQCCSFIEKYCQTEEQYQPLSELPHLSLSNTPSMKSLKSPTNIKRQQSIKNKQNQVVHQSASSIQNKSKKLLKSIQQSQQQGLKTSRYLKKLESQKKKSKPNNTNISTAKKRDKLSNIGSIVGKKYKLQNIQLSEDRAHVLSSFDSSKKKNFTQRKSFKNSINRFMKQPTTQEKVMNFSFNSSILDMSESKSRVGTRKSSINMNNDSFIGSSSNNNISRKPITQSFSTNNMSTTFTTDDQYDETIITGSKRMIISEQTQLKIQEEFLNRLQALGKKTAREQKVNNIRISLLKRLEDKHFKAQQVTK